MDSDDFRDRFAGFEWPYFMPTIDSYKRLLSDSPFSDAKVWGENADRYFPNVEAMLGWLDQPAIVPFKQHLDEPMAERFHEAAAARMIEYTKQDDGTCFETFRRINVFAKEAESDGKMRKHMGDQVSWHVESAVRPGQLDSFRVLTNELKELLDAFGAQYLAPLDGFSQSSGVRNPRKGSA